MNIAILGGSFDPPHIGHELVAFQVKEHLGLDQVWLMPCFLHPFNKKLSPAEDRLAMSKYLQIDDIVVSDFEIKQKKISYTIDTLNLLSKTYTTDSFHWIISSDQLSDFQRWKDWQKIITAYKLIIFPRDIATAELEGLVKKHLELKNIPETIVVMNSPKLLVTNISSTSIRERVGEGLAISHMLPEKVEEYIKACGLYSKYAKY